jgi:hypothetical protein
MVIQSLFKTRRVTIILLLAITGMGCQRDVNEPLLAPAATITPVPTNVVILVPSPSSTVTVQATQTPAPTVEPVAQEGLLYRDEFTRSDSGWNQLAFDNSYIGYHEPGYYHVEVHTPNASELVPIPGQSFTDFTAELEVFADVDLSAAEGDYSYGLVFRRSGNLYYAFTISPTTKIWTVTKHSLAGREILQEGNEEAIRGVGMTDTLQVDASGDSFTFHINGEPVARARDDAYTSGEVGFYVQTLDNAKAHVHFDTITIREVEAAQLVCNIVVQSVNIRSGPGTDFRRLDTLLLGDQFEPLGRTQDRLWIQARVEGNGQVGWVANDKQYAACNVPIEDLAISEP